LRCEQLADITVPPLAKSTLGNEHLQLTTPIDTSTVLDYRDGPVSRLIAPEAVVEIYLVSGNDDEPLLDGRGAFHLRLRYGAELGEHPDEGSLRLVFFAGRSTRVRDPHQDPTH
jgi:hypothetical protein